MIELGTKVKWVSQAHGSYKTKEGIVVQVVPEGSRPDINRFPKLDSSGMCRDHDSYVVKVDVGKKPGKTFKYYWPRVNSLEEV